MSAVQAAPPTSSSLPKPVAPPTAGHTVQVLIWRLLASACALFASVLISRGLGPEGRGAYSLYVATATTLVIFAKLGLEQANVYFYASRGVSMGTLRALSTVMALTAGTLGILVMLGLPVLMPSVFGDAVPMLLFLAALGIPLNVHQQVIGGLQTLAGRVTHQFMAVAVGSLVQVLLLVGMAWHTGLTTTSVLWINAIMVGLIWLVTVGKPGPRLERARLDLALVVETLRYSLVLHVGMCLFFLHLRVDLFMLKTLSDLRVVGVYSIAVMLAETVQLVTDSLAIALVPRQVGNTIEEAARVALRGMRINALVGLALSAGWAVIGYPLIPLLFGEAFAPAYWPLVALLPGIVCMGLQRVAGPTVLRTGRSYTMSSIYALALVTNVLLNLWLIPAIGAVGASLASTISYALGALLFVAWTARLAHLPITTAIPTWRDVQDATGAVRGLIARRPPAA